MSNGIDYVGATVYGKSGALLGEVVHKYSEGNDEWVNVSDDFEFHSRDVVTVDTSVCPIKVIVNFG